LPAMSYRTTFLVFCLGTLSLHAQKPSDSPKTEPTPPSPFVDKGACPFECCTYREWVADKEISLMDQPNGNKIVAQLHKDEKVQGVTGEVHSVPLRAIARHDDPGTGVKAGDVIYVLHPIGEGYWKAWHKGKLVETDDVPEKGLPRYTWWVQIKTSSGAVGWTVSHGNFANQDACG